jgi:histidinol-phosphate aminotransferase
MIEPRLAIKNLERIRDFGSGRENRKRLDKNERIIPFSKKEFSIMMRGITPELLTIYPDQNPLYQKLSRFLGIPSTRILLTPGSDSAIKTIFETYVNPGDQVIFPKPTYAMVDVYAHMFEADITNVGYTSELVFKFDSLIQNITKKTRLVFIANPNQPTSTLLTKKEFETLLEKTHYSGTLLVVDEAYIEFAEPDYNTLEYVDSHDNLFITRTFSKGFGLASARLGYIVTQEHNIDFLYRVKPLFDINLFSLKCGEFLIDRHDIVEKYVQSVKQGKRAIHDSMHHLGIHYIDGHTNFIHLKIPTDLDGMRIAEKLREQGYDVRITGMGLPAVIDDCIRITVGPEREMIKFLSVFKKILKAERKGF